MSNLRGLFTAIVTPFDKSGALNLDAIPPFLAFQREGGIDGVVVSGTNGEGVSLSVDERRRLLEMVIRHKGSLKVIAGTGAASVTDAIDLTRHAAAVGADAVLVLPPFFFKGVTAQGVAAYYRRVMDASTRPVLLYSIPQHSAVDITDEIIAQVQDHARFAGLKDSAGGWERTRALITGHPDKLIYPGSDPLLARALATGAAGAITGLTNALPGLMVAVKRIGQAGQDTGPAQARVDAAHAIMLDYPLIAVSKSILAYLGLPRMWVRPPLIDLSDALERDLIARLREQGLIGQ